MGEIESIPELPEGLRWPGAGDGSLRAQRGHVVALAFVNAGSVWCRQRLAELLQWQARQGGRLRVLGVNVPRFDCERGTGLPLLQLRRDGIALPLLQDDDWVAWQRFGIQAWPTVLLIDGEGRLRARATGQDGIAALEKAVAALCGALPPVPEDDGRWPPPTAPEPDLPLRFPAGLAATEERLYVADSGHHRILECNHAGRVLRRFGMGNADFIDGDGGHAAFCRPQGLSLVRQWLYVADTGNHALRRIDLRNGHVDTLCGSGQAGEPVEDVVGAPRAARLNQPLALSATDSEVHLALAGDQRIWSYDLGGHRLRCRAGSGQLEVRDGSGAMAAFAQPSGLALVQQTLYVCDVLGSALRSLQLRSGLVQTLLGQGPWQFGDADGPRERARLQYPQAIALSPDAPLLWIADSGNGRLRTLRLGGGELSTAALPRRLQGPAGLALAAGKVWIAETDAHAVLRYDPISGELAQVPVDD